MANRQQSLDSNQIQTEEWIQSIKDAAKETSANSAQSANQSAQSANQSAQQQMDQSAGFLQQTGEKMTSMAQGAVDGAKNALGMGQSNK